MSEIRNDRSLSLREKWAQSWQHRPRRKITINMPSPKVLNNVAQSCFVFGFGGIASWGVAVAIPFLYGDFQPWVLCAQQVFGCFLAFQLLVNWLCIKFVDTTYKSYLLGELGGGVEEVVMQTHDDSRGNPSGEQGTWSPNGDSATFRHNATSSSTISVDRSIPTSNEALVYALTGPPDETGEAPKRTSFPYFAWAPCFLCSRPRPPRCHHCSLCKGCVLKRDHHCYFAGACVGYKNMRHFTVFIFWAVVATCFATLHCIPYYYVALTPEMAILDLIVPVALVRALFGYIHFKIVILTSLGWLSLIFTMWAMAFLKQVCSWIYTGNTSFEIDAKMKIYDGRGLREKLRAVFGRYWLLNFIVPLHFIFPPIDDPVHWPDIKA